MISAEISNLEAKQKEFKKLREMGEIIDAQII